MNKETREIIEETTIAMVDVFRKMTTDNPRSKEHDMVAIMISVLTSINATILHSFVDAIIVSDELDCKTEAFADAYTECFGNFMMKVGDNTFATCVAKIESLQNKEVH